MSLLPKSEILGASPTKSATDANFTAMTVVYETDRLSVYLIVQASSFVAVL
jgi:hypothetical protein